MVIQGQTTYCKEMVQLYKNVTNVVWSTWEDEPEENLKIISSNMPVIVNSKPKYSGHLNINLQVVSTFAGVEYLKEKNVTEILKLRGDIRVSDITKLFDILQGRKLSFLQMCKPGARPLMYFLDYIHMSHDYPADVMFYATTDVLYSGLNFYVDEFYAIPPEALITYHLLINSLGVPFKLEYQHLIENGVTFFLQDCLDNGIDIFWLKKNASISEGTKNKDEYEY